MPADVPPVVTRVDIRHSRSSGDASGTEASLTLIRSVISSRSGDVAGIQASYYEKGIDRAYQPASSRIVGRYGGVVFASLQIGLGIKRSDSEQPAYAVGSGHGGANVYATIQ